MKKSLIALAAMGAFASAANAQTSVTLYGVVDVPIEYNNHLAPASTPIRRRGPERPSAFAARWRQPRRPADRRRPPSGSRWGLRGTEDLGGGLKALFVLESGFGLDDGRSQQGGRLFGRQAYVGMQSNTLGRLTFGRQYTTMFDMFANFSPTGYATIYEPVVAQLGTNFRSDNTVRVHRRVRPGHGRGALELRHRRGCHRPCALANAGAGEAAGNFNNNAAAAPAFAVSLGSVRPDGGL